jgi:hypothetical protein
MAGEGGKDEVCELLPAQRPLLLTLGLGLENILEGRTDEAAVHVLRYLLHISLG